MQSDGGLYAKRYDEDGRGVGSKKLGAWAKFRYRKQIRDAITVAGARVEPLDP